MAKIISKKISVNASAAKPLGKPPPRDKTLGIEPDIHSYNIEGGDENVEGEESETLVVHGSNLAVSKQNLITRKFPYIDTFDHEGPALVNAMRDLTSGMFEHLDITSPMDVYQRVAYTQQIIRGAALKNYKAVLVEYKRSAKELAGDKWTLGVLKGLSTDDLWT